MKVRVKMSEIYPGALIKIPCDPKEVEIEVIDEMLKDKIYGYVSNYKKIPPGVHLFSEEIADIATNYFKERFDKVVNEWCRDEYSLDVIRKALFNEED